MGRKRHSGLYSAMSPADYAARVGVTAARVRRWLREGLPGCWDWSSLPASRMVHVKRADEWLRDRDVTVLRHPQPVVYVVHDVTRNRFKVGFTSNIDRRYREHASELASEGCRAALLGVMPGDRALERFWIAEAEDCECYLGEEWCWPDPEWFAELKTAINLTLHRGAA